MLAYTGDTGPSPLLVEVGRDADLLIADATYAAIAATKQEYAGPVAVARSGVVVELPG